MKKVFFAIIICICLTLSAYPYPALLTELLGSGLRNAYTGDIERIDDREYFPAVRKLIREAKESIHIVMYMATYTPNKPNSPSNQLLEELVAAHKKGVKVRVVLDQEKLYSDKNHYNDPVYFFLKSSGIRVDYEELYTRTHPKLIIIDGKITVIGSHNWSDSAFKKNRETSVVIKSPEISREYIEWFNRITVYPRSTPPSQSKIPDIYLPSQFLTDPNLGIKLHGKRLTFYLYLLKRWEESGQKPFYLNYKDTAVFLGWDEHSRRTYRILINDALRMFHKHSNLILYKPKRGKSPEIELLDYTDHNKPLKPNPEDCFVVPGAFFEFGWIMRLSRNAKYFYLVNLLETSRSPNQKGWWSRSRKYLRKKYHFNRKILPKAIKELRIYRILKVKYSPYKPSLGKRLSPNRYLLLPLYSWALFQKELENLDNIYGKEKVKEARSWAEIILEENNPEVIEKFINYADQYGNSIVQYAIDYVAQRQIYSSKRNFPYVRGIILNKAQELENN